MVNQELIAPKEYNMMSEVEKFAKDPEKLALIWEDEAGNKIEITYADLIKNANKIGHVFKNAGLKKGDAILIMSPRLIDTYEIYIAALKIGLVITPTSDMLRTTDLEYRIEHGDVKAVVVYHPFVDKFEKLEKIDDLNKFVIGKDVNNWENLTELKETQSDELDFEKTMSDDVAFLSYTSGTTGNPKGAIHTHGWAYAHLNLAAKNWLSIKEGDKVWATAGPGWQKWLWSPFLAVLGMGATGYVYHGGFDPKRYLEMLEEQEINVLCCTPTEYRLMSLVEDLDVYNFSHLRSAVSAGEPLNREVIDTFIKHFDVKVRDGYGQTENTLLIGVTESMELRPGSMGKPMIEGYIDIIDEDGKSTDEGIVGDIAIHRDTPALFTEYYKEPERTEMQYRGDYYITGDRASKDADGYYWFEGRADDIIVSSGYTIGPFEVEDALLKHPAVKECAVVAEPDDVRGSVVKAYIVLRSTDFTPDDALIKEIQNHVKNVTAPYKYPRKVVFVEDLPKTISGKIRRIELREASKK